MRICCLCTGNTCRSPMLAALLNRALAEAGLSGHTVSSAGVAAEDDQPASLHAVACMQRRGCDLTDHRSHRLRSEEASTYDRFLCLGPSHAAYLREHGTPAERIHILAAASGGVSDPYGGDASTYEQCAATLECIAHALVADLSA